TPGLRRRPMVEAAPFATPCVEQRRFGELAVALSLEPVGEPFALQLSIVEAGRAAEAEIAERDAGIGEPLAVVPRSHHQMTEPCGVNALEGGVGCERPVFVLLVPPAAHGERGGGRVSEVAGQGAGVREGV